MIQLCVFNFVVLCCWLTFSDAALSLETCSQQVQEELDKPAKEQDIPKLLKLWLSKDYYEDRRRRISTFPAGHVKDLIVVFPLLQCPTFVSIVVTVLMYLLWRCWFCIVIEILFTLWFDFNGVLLKYCNLFSYFSNCEMEQRKGERVRCTYKSSHGRIPLQRHACHSAAKPHTHWPVLQVDTCQTIEAQGRGNFI